MQILIITEEDEFYLPLALDTFLKECKHEVLGVVCARNPLLKGKLDTAKTFKKAFGVMPVLQQGFRLVKAKLYDRCPLCNRTGRYFSIKRTCQAHQISYSHCDKVNAPEFIEHCRNMNLDLIVCISPTQIFKEEIINLPKYGCINIHTANLPNYRGLYPVYWAMVHDEKSVGICIHYIEKGIDTGRILLRDEENVPEKTTMDYMLQTTKIRGAKLLARAVEEISQGTVEPTYAEGEGSYFSFPTPESYQKFKKQGFKLW